MSEQEKGPEGCICPQDGSTCWGCGSRPSNYCEGYADGRNAEQSLAAPPDAQTARLVAELEKEMRQWLMTTDAIESLDDAWDRVKQWTDRLAALSASPSTPQEKS